MTAPVGEGESTDTEKKMVAVDQITHHIRTGQLPPEPEVTPVNGQDGQVRQYLMNNPIDNPDENEVLCPL